MNPHEHEFEPKVEEDTISRAAFWGTAGVTIVVVVISVFVASGFFHLWARGRTPLYSSAPPVASAEIGIVEQTLILDTRRGLDEKQRQRESLHEFGWVDAQHRFAKIPIDRAMDLVADPSFMRRAFAPDGGT